MLQYIDRVDGPVHGQLLDADVQVLVCWMVPHEPHTSLQVPVLAHSLHVPPTKQQLQDAGGASVGDAGIGPH
jgi:hypothetical protein